MPGLNERAADPNAGIIVLDCFRVRSNLIKRCQNKGSGPDADEGMPDLNERAADGQEGTMVLEPVVGSVRIRSLPESWRH